MTVGTQGAKRGACTEETTLDTPKGHPAHKDAPLQAWLRAS